MGSYIALIRNRHTLIDNGQGLLLIDTGSPQSFHQDGFIWLNERQFEVEKSLMGTNVQYISQKVGVEVSGLLGMDIISHYSMWINTGAFGGFIGFFPNDDVASIKPVRTFCCMNCPGIILNINGQNVRMLFDTGAPVSYLNERITSQFPVCGAVKDFSPLTAQEFEVELHAIPTFLEDMRFEVLYGSAPAPISNLLYSQNIDGIIGYDLIENFRIIVRGGRILFPPQGI